MLVEGLLRLITPKEELQDEDEIEKLLSSMEGMMKKLNFKNFIHGNYFLLTQVQKIPNLAYQIYQTL